MDKLAQELGKRAARDGFSALRVARLAPDAQQAERLRQFIAAGRHGDMAWMAETEERRAHAQAMWPEARTAIVLALDYGQDLDPFARLRQTDTGVISLYALNRDYHEIILGRLKQIAQWLARRSGADAKAFVDTAPLMEKPLAQKAGLGWQGKHTNLVSRQRGSWFFVGTILSAADFAPTEPETDHCGTCRACLDICPTNAFPAPYQLDARRCISYLTIEHGGHIAREFREAMGNRIYGCDDCLAACPWNKFAQVSREAKLLARDDLKAPSLAHLLTLDDAAFRQLFSGSPVKRTGRDRFIRNVLIAAGNSGEPRLVAKILPLLDDAAAIVRAMAVWALSRLMAEPDFSKLRSERIDGEADADVRREWDRA